MIVQSLLNQFPLLLPAAVFALNLFVSVYLVDCLLGLIFWLGKTLLWILLWIPIRIVCRLFPNGSRPPERPRFERAKMVAKMPLEEHPFPDLDGSILALTLLSLLFAVLLTVAELAALGRL